MSPKQSGPVVQRRRGRPKGRSRRGNVSERALFDAALELFSEQGFEQTTLRQIATRAGVSSGLLYRYFPSKRAVVLALHDQLSLQYAVQMDSLAEGTWSERFLAALETSLEVLAPHRTALVAITSNLVSNREDGIFSPERALQRRRVQGAFENAVAGATNAPEAALALGRLLYLLHLGVILWWLLDRSPRQRASHTLVRFIARGLPLAKAALHVPMSTRFLTTADALFREAMLGEADASG